MRGYRVVFILLLLLSTGCTKKNSNGIEEVHWDRDMCQRCQMVLSERKFAAEIINPKTGKAYKFDDIGCAVLWLKEEHIPWAKSAKIWVVDAKSGKWIDARGAKYTDDAITPMAYGISAFSSETFPKGKKALSFQEAVKKIELIEQKNSEALKKVQ